MAPVSAPLLALSLLGALAACGARAARLLEHTGSARPLSETKTLHVNVELSSKQQPSPPAPGLPQECLTYQQRYSRHQYQTGLAHSAQANLRHRHSKYVMLLKLHRVYEDRLPLDIILNARAMAAEVTEAGMHFYILYQPPFGDEETLTREEVLEFLPPDLRPFIVVHDFNDDFAAYHELGAHDDPQADTYGPWGPGPKAPYVAVSRFMRRYTAYQYAWVVEFDVRWTGGSWGEFFNAALDLARQSTEELNARPGRIVDKECMASRTLPASTEGLPDLLTFDGISDGSKWHGLRHNMAEAPLREMWGMVYFGSRKLWHAVHESSSKGVGTHLEAALATIAAEQNLKAPASGCRGTRPTQNSTTAALTTPPSSTPHGPTIAPAAAPACCCTLSNQMSRGGPASKWRKLWNGPTRIVFLLTAFSLAS